MMRRIHPLLLWLPLCFALSARPAAAHEHRVVRPGETLEAIAATLGVSAAELANANALGPGEQPATGAVLFVPTEEDRGAGGMLLALHGTGTARSPGEAPVPLAPGIGLRSGMTVCTDDHSYATVRLSTRDRTWAHDDVSLLSGTCLTLDDLAISPERRSSLLSVASGSVAVRAASQGTNAVIVRTSSGVTTGVGGGFRVTVEQGASRTEAIERSVSVQSGGSAVDLPAGYGSRLRAGAAPTPPVLLLRPGQPMRPREGEELRRPEFTWMPVDRALGDRIEVAVRADFSDIALVEDVDEARWAPDTLFLPTATEGLWWRISAFDRTGFQGVASSPREALLPPGIHR
jgi:hypothetical protein